MDKIIYRGIFAIINLKMTLEWCSNRRFTKKAIHNSTAYHARRQKNHVAQARMIFLYQEIIRFNSGKIFPMEKYHRARANYFSALKSLWQDYLAILLYQKIPGSTFGRSFQAGKSLAGLFGRFLATFFIEKMFHWICII